MRDQQRSKVYAWERKNLQGDTDVDLTLAACQHLVNRIARHFKCKRVPQVTDGRGRRIACWTNWQYQIKLPRWARTEVVVCHEAAHWIEDVLYGNKPAHGREFVAIMMYLLTKFHGSDPAMLARTANASRVDFGSVDACKPSPDHRHRKYRR